MEDTVQKEIRIEDENVNVGVDFTLFGDKDKFTHIVNLEKASVTDCINYYIQYKSKNKQQAQRTFNGLRHHIVNLEKQYSITLYPVVVGDMFWNQFHNYLFGKGMAPSTIDYLSSKLSTVLRWSAKYGAKISPTLDDCYLSSMKAPNAKPKISLSQDEVSRITYFDIDSINCRPQMKETLKKVRDQFVLACFLGQRYSDIVRVEPDNFKGSMFTITQQKTGNTAVVDIKKIAAYPKVVKQILEKYNYCAPYPKDVSDYNRYLHKLFFYAGFDEEIKYEYKVKGRIISKTFKKWQLISSHTARRTMITNCVQRGVNTEEVRRASGHKSEAAFSGYICWNADE